MKEVSLKELLEAGCHFGHQVPKSNPKARDFVYTSRDGIQIIDLAKTKVGLEKASDFVKKTVSEGGIIIFVGTKKQARSLVLEEAKRCGAFYMTKRWVGGLLTNWEEVKKNLKRMEDLRQNLKSDVWTKKEKVLMEKTLKKLEIIYGGIEGLKERPQALYIVDTHKEDGAVREGVRMSVPIVGIVDTNADPGNIDYPIPAHDDAGRSIQLSTSFMADAVIEGKELWEKKNQKEQEKQEKRREKEEDKEKEKEEKKGKAELSPLAGGQKAKMQAKKQK